MPDEPRDGDVRSVFGPWLRGPGELRLRCGFAQATLAGWCRPLLVRPGEEVLLLVEVRPARPAPPGTHELTVELLRGDRRRDVWRQRFGPAGLCSAFRMRWGPTGSSRLTARLLLDGREAARPTLLLGAPLADAQGRFAAGGGQPRHPPRPCWSTPTSCVARWGNRFLATVSCCFLPPPGRGR